MGTDLGDLVGKEEITLDYLQGRKVGVDSYNIIYQFLASIRGQDGTPLMDSHGNVTSHLTGLLYRTVNLLDKGIKPVFVFDGEAPLLKKLTLEKRKEIKIEAQKNLDKAKEEGDEELMKKYASRTSRLNDEMKEEAKKLVEAFGLPAITAPSEAEAQASLIVKNDDAYAIATNDADALLFEAPRIIRNVSIAGRKKKTNKLSYETVNPDMILLDENLKHLGINQDQLIVLAMLVGTDFNMGGIKGIGPKSAIKLVKKHENNFDAMFNEAKWADNFEFEWKEVFDLIKHMKVNKEYELKWGQIDEEKVRDLLVDKHDFSEERVKGQISELLKLKEKKGQKGLGEFFG